MIKTKRPSFLAFRLDYNSKTNVLFSDVSISLPFALTGEKKEWKNFKAIWDTGATNCVISEKIIKALDLKPTGQTEVSTAAGIIKRNTFIVDIGLINGIAFPDVRVTDGDLGDKFDVLIGMDIIGSGDFSISNASNKTIFSFCVPPLPKPDSIDLLKISDAINKKELTKTAKNQKKRQRKKKK